MKLFFWRRRAPHADLAVREKRAADSRVMPAHGIDTVRVPRAVSSVVVPADPIIEFARDYLAALGANVRMTDSDTLMATLPDGRDLRYTASPLQARTDESAAFLVAGSEAVTSLLEESADRARVVSLGLANVCDPVELARQAIAGPTPGCGRCVSKVGVTLCERCGMRDGQIVISGLGKIASAQELSRCETWSVEATYLLSGIDRSGRLDDLTRIAVDAVSGSQIPFLSDDQVISSQPQQVPCSAAELNRCDEAIKRLLRLRIDALVSFLRARSAADYARRLYDLQQTNTRLEREDPRRQVEINDEFRREARQLEEAFLVDVTARLEHLCLIASKTALVSVHDRAGAELRLNVDVGRKTVLPPECASCGTRARVGTLCRQSHFTCVDCRSVLLDMSKCPACTGPTGNGAAPAQAARHVDPHLEHSSKALSVADLDAMTPSIWEHFVRWLLECDGYSMDEHVPAIATDGRLHLCSSRDGKPVSVLAMRFDCRTLLGAAEVREVASRLSAAAPAERILIATADADLNTQLEAQRLGVRLLDRQALDTWLSAHVNAYALEREQAERETGERAIEATRARNIALEHLHEVERTLAASLNTRRASGGSAVAASAAVVSEVRRLAHQAFLAWEAWIADWTAAFDELPDRSEGLVIVADRAKLHALSERADHLGRATEEAVARLGETPSDGELGYGPWHKAVLAELTSMCESIRWRLLAVDPSQRSDFVAAHDAEAQERAVGAQSAAWHATARVESCFADMRARARLG